MGSTTAARSWQRVCVIALSVFLVAVCAVVVLLPLSGRYEVADLTGPSSPGAPTRSPSGASAGSRHVTFTCGSDLFGKDYTEAAATAILGPGRSFLSNADLLSRACDKARFRRTVRVVLLLASAVVLLALGLLWPRRKAVRWTALTLALILGLIALVVPVDGTLRW